MPESAISIANSALVKVGAPVILSFDDGNAQANAVKVRYNECRKTVLRMHPWNFAVDRVVLSPTTDTPAFGFTYSFQLPANCLRVLQVNQLERDEFTIEGRRLLLNTNVVYLKYVKDVTDATQMDSLFGDVLASYLAWDISFLLTQSISLKERLWQEYLKCKPKATSTDAQEQPADPVEANDFLEARVSGAGGAIPMRDWPSEGY